MRVLLVNPNYRNVYAYIGNQDITPIFPPMGIAYIAAFLRENGISVDILDANALALSFTEIKQFIEGHKDIEYVGITAVTNTIEEAGEIAKLCCPSIKVVVGGYHSSALPRQTLEEFPRVDIVVRGEGEITMLELVSGKPLDQIRGISYRENHEIVDNPLREHISNVEVLPFPARDLLPLDKYASFGAKRTPLAHILSERGCPFSCIFCIDHLVHGKKFRYRSPEDIVREIEFLMQEYGVKEIDFIDDNFTLLPNRVERFCDLLISRGINKELLWRCSNGVRIDKITPSLLKSMRRAGCYMVSLGIESGNTQILTNIKKRIKLDQVEMAVKWCQEAGIETRGLFMLGNLGDDRQTMEDTINFAKKLDLDSATFHITIPFPMTEYWRIIKEEGELFPNSWKDYTPYKKVTFKHGSLTPELLLEMQRKAYRGFYLRPRYMFRKFLQVRSLKQLRLAIAFGKGVLRLQGHR